MNLKIRLAVMNFWEFAVWGAYLTSMGTYLVNIGMASHIGWFYAVQGVVSIFMPALMGIVADRWIPAQRLLGACHLLAALFMFAAAWQGEMGAHSMIFPLYTLSVAFYMPTLALSNSVAYSSMTRVGMDTVKDFPPIRVFGTIGFICMMWFTDLMGFQSSQNQFVVSGSVGLLLFLYSFTLPHCPTSASEDQRTLVDAFGLKAFSLFKQKRMAIFFLFSMLLGVSLQITNGYANPYITSFGSMPEYADTFGVQHANILISLSQASETCCILLIPFFMKRFGIGVAFRLLRLGESRQWRVAFRALHAGVWRGFRLFQCLRLALRRPEYPSRDAFQCPGHLFPDDQRHWRYGRYALGASRCQRLYFSRWSHPVADLLVYLCRLRLGGGHLFRLGVPR